MNRNRKPLFLFITVFITGALFILYVGHQVYLIFNSPIKTENAMYITVDDAISADGFFIRSEQVLEGKPGIIEYTVGSGEKVAKNSAVADVFEDQEAAALSRKAKELDEKIDDIEYAKSQSIDKMDAAKIDGLITSQIEELSETAETGVLTGAYGKTRDLNALIIRRTIAEQGGVFNEDALDKLKAEREDQKNKIGGRIKNIRSPVSGYFSKTVDGFESLLDPKNMDKLSTDTILNLEKSVSAEKLQDAVGKIVYGFSWYFAAVIGENEADTLTVGRTVRLRFSQGPGYDVPAIVDRIKKDGDGKALVIFQSNYMDDEIVSMRYQQVDIIKKSVEGIRVSKGAIRLKDGKEGVFVISGNRVIFKEIKRLFVTDSFYVVSAKGKNDSDISIYDEIVVNAKDLEDKKVIG
ncbi:MAG: HlyD family efflux transporter periplasmic adaptor subunit [Bacillota bacterium]|nr:HlyD family efflux transporter periplasmic adaptor subunit [Bacillota bacterium]